MATKEATNERAEPLAGSLRPMTLPAIAVKLALGARFTVDRDQATIEFERDRLQMHMTDFDAASRVARRIKRAIPPTVTPGTIVELTALAYRYVAEEVFAPGARRMLFFPAISKASAFYRCILPALSLSSGSRVVAHVSPMRIGREALDYDIIVVQIDNSPKTYGFAQTLQRMGKKIVYEIDDAFDALEPWHAVYDIYSSPEGRDRVYQMMRLADLVTVTTNNLKERYAQYARRIEVLPNYISVADWPKAEPREPDDEFRILWAGSPSHVGDLAVVGDALSEFCRREPRATLTFFGQEPRGISVARERVRVIPWCDYEEYPNALADIQADVAIAPLADIPFNESKSNVKLLEYGATGYPTIASNVGPYRDTIRRESLDGILCDDGRAWVEALEALLARKDLRTALRQGAIDLARRHDIERHRADIEQVYLDLVGEDSP